MEWVGMRKGVAWLFRYREVSLKANSRYLDALAAAVFATDSKGKAVGDNWGAADIDFAVEKYQEMINAGIRFSVPVPYKLAKPSPKIIIYDTGSDRLGSRRHQFDN
jgi:hypothetical protein